MEELSTLYHKGKGGAIYSWRVWTEGSSIFTEYGQIDGKKQISEKEATDKNVGKKNYIPAFQQAKIEALAMHKYKLDRKYSETVEDASQPLSLPMLAETYTPTKKIPFPADVQPKLDGVRCKVFWDGDGEIFLMSRSGKRYHSPGLEEVFKRNLPTNAKLDGELYIHGVAFDDISSKVKNNDEDGDLEYFVYDCEITDEENTEERPWSQRYMDINDVVSGFDDLSRIHITTTITVNSKQEIEDSLEFFLDQGYEGVIIRLHNGVYIPYRSSSLLKYKKFTDGEYRIVGVEPGEGKFRDMAIFTCITPEGRTFRCVPKGTAEHRRDLLTRGPELIDQLLKVKYFSLTEDNIPRFPVGLGIRLPEDL